MDNCIGATPTQSKIGKLAAFYRDHRLAHQFDLAANKGRKFEGAKNYSNLSIPFLHPTPPPQPASWRSMGGNAGYDRDGTPFFLIRRPIMETEKQTSLSPTCLAGFPLRFMMPMKGIPSRPWISYPKNLYNLYHELNHYNLFGGAMPAPPSPVSINFYKACELIHPTC